MYDTICIGRFVENEDRFELREVSAIWQILYLIVDDKNTSYLSKPFFKQKEQHSGRKNIHTYELKVGNELKF